MEQDRQDKEPDCNLCNKVIVVMAFGAIFGFLSWHGYLAWLDYKTPKWWPAMQEAIRSVGFS